MPSIYNFIADSIAVKILEQENVTIREGPTTDPYSEGFNNVRVRCRGDSEELEDSFFILRVTANFEFQLPIRRRVTAHGYFWPYGRFSGVGYGGGPGIWPFIDSPGWAYFNLYGMTRIIAVRANGSTRFDVSTGYIRLYFIGIQGDWFKQEFDVLDIEPVFGGFTLNAESPQDVRTSDTVIVQLRYKLEAGTSQGGYFNLSFHEEGQGLNAALARVDYDD